MPAIQTTRNEQMADISAQVSGKVDVGAALGFLEGFLSIFDGLGQLGKLHAELRSGSVKTIQFHIREPTRDSINLGHLSAKISDFRFDRANALVSSAHKYYLTVSTVRSRILSIIPKAASDNVAALNIEADPVAMLSGKYTVTKENTGALIYRGLSTLAVGVSLVEIIPDNSQNAASLRLVTNAINLMHDEGLPKEDYVFVGDSESGPAFVQI